MKELIDKFNDLQVFITNRLVLNDGMTPEEVRTLATLCMAITKALLVITWY